MKKAAVLVFAVFLFFLVYFADRLPEMKNIKNEKTTVSPDNIGIISETGYQPLNYNYQKAMWFTSMDYAKMLDGKSEEDFTSEVSQRFENAAKMGINTAYVQVRAFGDAYYPSDIFPPGKYYTVREYDPLLIMIREAHAFGLSFHVWINPLRCVNTEELSGLDDSYSAVNLFKSGKGVKNVDGRLWLDPSYTENIRLVCEGVREIAEKYRVDGVHIDDYFYPVTDESFDNEEFVASGEQNLAAWRRENTSRLVSAMYNTVKSVNRSLLFGISPQGSLHQNMDVQYADVEKWTSQSGFCDYITPQLYYGYENDECPFTATMEQWKNMISTDSVKLVIGLCTYKYGLRDEWAGNGADEWINSDDIVSGQTADVTAEKDIDGVAFYSYASTFEDDISSEIMLDGEMQEIREILKLL